MSSIKEYVPSIYDDVTEMEELVDAEDTILSKEEAILDDLENSQFIMTAPEHAIEEYEKLLNIYPSSTDTIEFRRARVTNRLSMTPPFSLPYLREKLDSIIGANKYTCYMDYDDYTLYIESSAEEQYWAEEIYITVNRLKPANIVFINKPLIVYNSNISEEIELTKTIYNYKLGTTWALGRNPFGVFESGGVMKMATSPSIQNSFLNDIATFSALDIDNVLVNDTEEISTFSTREADANVAIIEYTIPTSLGISTVTNIKLRDTENTVLTNSTVYIPILEDVIVKHKLIVKEGA